VWLYYEFHAASRIFSRAIWQFTCIYFSAGFPRSRAYSAKSIISRQSCSARRNWNRSPIHCVETDSQFENSLVKKHDAKYKRAYVHDTIQLLFKETYRLRPSSRIRHHLSAYCSRTIGCSHVQFVSKRPSAPAEIFIKRWSTPEGAIVVSNRRMNDGIYTTYKITPHAWPIDFSYSSVSIVNFLSIDRCRSTDQLN